MLTVMPSRQSRLERGALAGLGQDTGYITTDPSVINQPPAGAPESSWSSWLSQAVKIYTEYDLQKEVLDINLERAKQGLPPLDLARYGAGVNVGVSAETEKMIFIAVAVIAGAIILPKLMKR